ncbi:haloacid dehalogenase type II [Staphylococcus massiliensis]|uniref:haloacid dehalogenase type II n=1 Tax=Staphylococcus massiliensis TaxID=555791 RepID=UPI001EE0CE69|nr:haloacid dehalogenase type II [Staphylococcus massiliensis]MCG3402174.1 haloacid dehalogenase type II [Staphylococcus massiliensis]MCG3412860.1 haloacid dehalogenase type II [Staphylococcus massiliensis]
MTYKLIVFDIYGTLFDVRSIDGAIDQLESERTKEIGALWRKTQLEHAFLRQAMQSYVDFEEITINALRYALNYYNVGHTEKEIQYIASKYTDLTLFEDAKGLLKKAPIADYAILSNGTDHMLDQLAYNKEVDQHFKYIISVDQIRQFKPSPASYRLILNKSKLKREDILYVSSNSWDINGASSFGFDTAWVNRNGELFNDNGSKPTYEIKDLSELTQLVQ